MVNVFPVIAFPLLSFGHSLCVSGLFFFFLSSHCRDMKRAMHKQNHVMRGFCRSGGADVSHHTTPACSWTLYNSATIRQLRTRRETDDGVCCCEADMWLLNNTNAAAQTHKHRHHRPPGNRKIRAGRVDVPKAEDLTKHGDCAA